MSVPSQQLTAPAGSSRPPVDQRRPGLIPVREIFYVDQFRQLLVVVAGHGGIPDFKAGTPRGHSSPPGHAPAPALPSQLRCHSPTTGHLSCCRRAWYDRSRREQYRLTVVLNAVHREVGEPSLQRREVNPMVDSRGSMVLRPAVACSSPLIRFCRCEAMKTIDH